MTASRTALSIQWIGGRRMLSVQDADAGTLGLFDGAMTRGPDGVEALIGPLTERNAAGVRTVCPNLQPRPIGLHASVGTGDRLGLATAGQVRAFRASGKSLRPVFAQQSIREMDRLGRTPQHVLDDATFGCVEAGWTGPVGADADHLKTTADIDRCLDADFSLYTIDVGDFVDAHAGTPTAQTLAALPWDRLEDSLPAARRRYRALHVDLAAVRISVGETELAHAMAKYGRAVAEGVAMYRHLMAKASHEVEVEIAVDETNEPTTPTEHLYIATELARLGVKWVSFAPRHLGTFEKGVEFVGDRDLFFETVRIHSEISRALGPYKIGMHSGSDKFQIYEGFAEATAGLFHLKTSGTSYLVALAVVAERAPGLFRRIYGASFDAYRRARASYQVSADVSHVPDPEHLSEQELSGLLDRPATRQILHVGYGAVLRDDGAASGLDRELRAVLSEHHTEYGDALAAHIGRHLTPLVRRG